MNDESLGVFEEEYSSECESEAAVALVTDYISWQCKENVGMTLTELLDGKIRGTRVYAAEFGGDLLCFDPDNSA